MEGWVGLVDWPIADALPTKYKVALDSAAAGVEPAISSRKSNVLTTAPPSLTNGDDAVVVS